MLLKYFLGYSQTIFNTANPYKIPKLLYVLDPDAPLYASLCSVNFQFAGHDILCDIVCLSVKPLHMAEIH